MTAFFTTNAAQKWTVLAWRMTAVVGVAVPALMLLTISTQSTASGLTGGPVFTLGLMGVGIVAAATAGHFWTGVMLALLNMLCLMLMALALGMPIPAHLLSTLMAMVIASGSFAARGALFARSLSDKGWMMALFVVAGEASILLTAVFLPGWLPTWLLALLPAQWSSMAIQASLTGAGAMGALWPLCALAGTAATTLFTARLLPQRWPYLIMFTAWLGFSALVYFWGLPTSAQSAFT